MVSPRLPLLLRPLLLLLLLLLRPASSDWPETRYPEPDIKDMNPHTSGIPSVDRKELIVRYSCGEAGYGEDRVQASIDYTLCCRAMGRRCCMECKCQWALYYQMASACFDRYLTYKRDVQVALERWNKDASLYCKVSDMGDKYASHEENNVWRSDHFYEEDDEDFKYRNIALDDKRRGRDEQKEWCGGGAVHGPSRPLVLFVCLAASLALLAGGGGGGDGGVVP